MCNFSQTPAFIFHIYYNKYETHSTNAAPLYLDLYNV